MSSDIYARLRNIWIELEDSPDQTGEPSKRVYNRLDLYKEKGLRLACRFPERVWEFLIEIGREEDEVNLSLPDWGGDEV